MTAFFDYFVVFAEMRTGSNFLESNLNALEGAACYGEAFNPAFMGYLNKTELLGMTLDQREADPAALIARVREQPGVLGGFRYFHNHDPRVLDLMLEDPRCAKIVLTRNPLESYVSLKIARATNQWKLTDVKRRKTAQVEFDGIEFASHAAELQAFQVKLMNRLQASGQTAFYVAYDDLQNLEVMNGLARWLGVPGRLEALDSKLKRQNPGGVLEKIANPGDVPAGIAALDRFNLSRTPNFEPRRGPAVPGYVAGRESRLLYLPVRGGPDAEVVQWMANVEDLAPEALQQGMTQKQLRQWKRRNKGFRSFTVLRHPAARAHAVFCRRILQTGPGCYGAIRSTLRRQFKVPLPEGEPGSDYGPAEHRAAFAAYLGFVQANLAGQTSVRVDAEWASQAQALAGFAELGVPDLVVREEEAAVALPALAERLGCTGAPVPAPAKPDTPIPLADIYDEELEELIASVYQRDYVNFGFGSWQPQ
ncbi:nodulation protein NodH [Cribrihabitans neustonicus]|uniref:nodulation protein NodH n=1 Tax=Cribrihabitans neustonicus TaxID=1429085 RepID=UPI003B599BAD